LREVKVQALVDDNSKTGFKSEEERQGVIDFLANEFGAKDEG